MTGRGSFSVKSPPDLIAVGLGCSSLLIEAKATKGTSIAFDRVDEHQREHLFKFDGCYADAYGVVALLQYNGKLGGERLYKAWLIPIWFWNALRAEGTRKSMSFSDHRIDRWEMRWVPGHGFVTTDALLEVGVTPASDPDC